MLVDPWEHLSLYESRDYVARRLRERHGREPNDTQCQQIISHVSQARQYFASALGAGELARPVLLYYGVLALSRGLILFGDPRLREARLDQRHGLFVDWSALHAEETAAIRSVPELRVKVDKSGKGTFPELCRASGTQETARFTSEGAGLIPRHWRWRQAGPDVPAGTEFGVREVLGRLPDLYFVFAECLAAAPECLIVVIGESAAGVWVELLDPVDGEPNDERAGRLLGDVASRPVRKQRISDQAKRSPALGKYAIRSAKGSLRTHVPEGMDRWVSSLNGTLRNDEAGNLLLVPRMDNGLGLSSLALLYLVSYFTGMLVRYYPSAWRAFLDRRPGDSAFPVLRAAVSLVERRFPILALESLNAGD